jgi:RNA-directed DNA polymerase
MHRPIPAQGKWLRHVVRGYFNYHAVPTNGRALVAFRTEIAKRWYRVLTRRSERTKLNWTTMKRLIDEWLPKPRILHPWPDKRFAVSHPR